MRTLLPPHWRVFDRALIIAIVLMFCLFGYASLHEHNRSERLALQGAQAHAAICALRIDLEHRVATSKQFLIDHPNGIPGIPAATIETSISNQRQTIEALQIIRCAN